MSTPEELPIYFYEPSGIWGPLSNYSSYPIIHYGVVYKTLEHYFQSRKFWIFDDAHAQLIIDADTPLAASKLGLSRRNTIDPFWETLKVKYMIQAVKFKVSQNKPVYDCLLSTGSSKLIYDSPRDTYWGSGKSGRGANTLGLIYETVRDECRAMIIKESIQ